MSTGKCDQEVYDNGSPLAVIDAPKEKAEEICQLATLLSGQEIDWHYFAGRVVIKCVGDAQKAADVLYPMLEDCPRFS